MAWLVYRCLEEDKDCGEKAEKAEEEAKTKATADSLRE
jgi:hypothetical protein